MKTNICKLTLLAVLILLGSLPAMAIIDKIEASNGGGGIPTKDYQPDETIPVPMLRGRWLRIYGGGTDLVQSVTDGLGVVCTLGNRKGGIGSYVEMTCVPDENASTSVRTVTLKYPAGSDTFKIQVKKVGTISKIEYEPTFSSASTRVQDTGMTNVVTGRGGTATPSRIPATNLPQDQEITLVVTGTKLGNVKLISNATAHFSGSVLSGARTLNAN